MEEDRGWKVGPCKVYTSVTKDRVVVRATDYLTGREVQLTLAPEEAMSLCDELAQAAEPMMKGWKG